MGDLNLHREFLVVAKECRATLTKEKCKRHDDEHAWWVTMKEHMDDIAKFMQDRNKIGFHRKCNEFCDQHENIFIIKKLRNEVESAKCQLFMMEKGVEYVEEPYLFTKEYKSPPAV